MYKYIFLLLAVCTLNGSAGLAQSLEIQHPFATDGCTASEDGTWRHCCIEHDILYWMGGTYSDRKAADEGLQTCMTNSGGANQAPMFYNGVRIFGTHLWATAWPPRDASTLTAEEKADMQSELELYASLGYPLDFEFGIRESILFQELSSQQKVLLRESLNQYAQTEEYQQFVNDYQRATGKNPFTVSFLK